MNNSTADFFDKKNQVLGHPAGLFVLFFTEMWERFSFYGMRALLVLFLVSSVGIGGWDWPRENALSLYGTYLALLYLTPIIGGQLADRYLGYRKAIIIGAVIITLGHASMAIEHIKAFMYIGLLLLVIGTGFFKPNMTSFISVLYQNHPEKKRRSLHHFLHGRKLWLVSRHHALWVLGRNFWLELGLWFGRNFHAFRFIAIHSFS